MRDFIELLILGLLIYWGIKFIKIKLKERSDKKKHERKYGDTSALVKREMMRFTNTINANEFYEKEEELKRSKLDGPGVYIFTNLTTNRRYVGQSVNIVNRVSTHLSGRGNGDVFDDISLGYEFTIQFISLESTVFSNLDVAEKNYITKYNSYAAGYNKTRGNS